MLLAVGVLATVLQLGPPTLAPTPARASGEEDPVAVLDAWTETTQVYANPDGTIAATIASEPIQAPDPTSETGWSPIAARIELSRFQVMSSSPLSMRAIAL